MINILKSIYLDHYVLRSNYKGLIVLYAIATAVGVLAKMPAITIAAVMVISAPFTGTYFSIYEKNNLEKLYGVLPLRKSEIVAGRYVYATLLGLANGIIAGIIAYIISIFTGNGASFSEYLNYFSLAFLIFCLFIGILFPLYFKFPLSKVYIFSNLPIYVLGVIVLFLAKKTTALAFLGFIIKYFTAHQYMIWILGFGLGLILLFVSGLLSYALISEGQVPGLSVEKPDKRLFFIDNLRSALTILVVLHHLSVIYAANTGFYYVEPSKDIAAIILLGIFQLFNQAYFMGFFFLLSGYFTPGSYDRKGSGSFLKNRLLRLGIPIILFVFVLSPIARIGTYQMLSSLTGLTGPWSLSNYFNMIGIGPIWFIIMLLVFDLGYLVWRMGVKNRIKGSEGKKLLAVRPTDENRTPFTFRTVVIFMLALAAASYLLRIVLPFAKYVLGFPSLAYLPQYISFFIIGNVAYRRNWLRRIPGTLGILGFVLAIISTVVLFPIAILGGGSAYLGNGTWQSGVYALWDSIFSVGMCLGGITFFRRFFDHEKKLGSFLSRQSFTVYIIHSLVIVFLAIALRNLHMEQLLKFGLAAITGIPLCYGVAWLVRQIPYAKKVL